MTGKAGLIIPVMDSAGIIAGCQIRPDNPGTGGKYTWLTSKPAGGPRAVTAAHVPPVPGANQPHDLVRLTEGPLKAHVATHKDRLLTIAITGCGLWKKSLPVLAALQAKTVRLAFDADITTNPQVSGALSNAVRGLVASGYEVEVERWDSSQGKGIDDVLSAGATTEVLSGVEAIRFVILIARGLKIDPALVTADQVVPWVRWYLSRGLAVELSQDPEVMKAAGRLEKQNPNIWTELTALLKQYPKLVRTAAWLKACRVLAPPPRKDQGDEPPYVERDGSTYAIEYNDEGQRCERLLANFTARIAEEIDRHVAGEKRLQFRIEAENKSGVKAAVTVEAERYSRMEWPESLGSVFAVASGRGVRDHLREAIQLISHHKGKVPRRAVYTSTGWHKHGDEWIYCHAGGAIGSSGLREGVSVELHSTLSRYRLPAPTDDPAVLTWAFEAHLKTWILATGPTAAIIATIPWRAVIAFLNASVHLGGPSGNRKTSAAQLAFQHFAADVTGRVCPMPASWRATENSPRRARPRVQGLPADHR